MTNTFDRVFFAVALTACFYGGMKYERYSVANNTLEQERNLQEIEHQRDLASTDVAKKVLDGLSQWEKNREVVIKEMHHETTKPVFYNLCATDEYVGMFNKVQSEARKTLTGKSDGKVQH